MKRWVLLVGTLLAGTGVLGLVAWLTPPAPIYAMSISEFLSRDLRDRPVRLQGMLVRRTLCKLDAQCGYRFRIADRAHFNTDGTPASTVGRELSVSYAGCVLPDTFRDVPGLELEATIEGQRCQSCHDFEASRVMAKCPSKYEMSTDGGVYRYPSTPVPRCSSLIPAM